MRRTLTVLIYLALALATSGAEVRQVRRHSKVSEGKRPLFMLTDVDVYSSKADEHYILVRDEGTAEQWVLKSAVDFARHESSYEVTDVRGEIFIRFSTPLQFSGDTREEYFAEYRANPALLAAVDPLVVFETGGASRSAKESLWNDPENARAWRSEFRRQMNPNLLEAIERMRPLYGQLPASMFYEMFIHRLLYGDEARTAHAAPVVRVEPDCGFDATFGFDCTDRQQKRISEAKKRGELLREY
jgi:hypothetical protein